MVGKRKEVNGMFGKKKRGLGSASEETRREVGRKGGKAKHRLRGLQAASEETRKRVARKGGSS